MARYIDADAVVSKLDNLVEEYVKHDCIQSSLAAGVLANFRDTELNEIPFADVAPVKHGEWLSAYDYAIKFGMTDKERLDVAKNDKHWNFCSLCNQQIRFKHNYCPNCGAKMKGGEG